MATTTTARTVPPTVTATRILIVEDDVELADHLGITLTRYGFVSETVHTRSAALDRAGSSDLILLDISLPDGDDLALCGLLAAHQAVIVISGRDAESDCVAALELGADDYLTKPFGARELVARCRAVLRRRTAIRRDDHTLVRAADLEIDIGRFEVRRHGRPLPLTTKEVALMVALARHPGTVIGREELANQVWGCALQPVNRALDAHISSLRRKLHAADHPPYIQTMHGVGFRLIP